MELNSKMPERFSGAHEVRMYADSTISRTYKTPAPVMAPVMAFVAALVLCPAP
jgi:hypothetical protein